MSLLSLIFRVLKKDCILRKTLKEKFYLMYNSFLKKRRHLMCRKSFRTKFVTTLESSSCQMRFVSFMNWELYPCRSDCKNCVKNLRPMGYSRRAWPTKKFIKIDRKIQFTSTTQPKIQIGSILLEFQFYQLSF